MVTMNHCHIGFIVFVILPSALLAECPNVQTKRNFEIERFMGKWYEIQRYANVWQMGQKCNTANYELKPDGSIIVTNRAIIRFIDYPWSRTGEAWQSATDPAKLTVSYSSIIPNTKLWVLDTDYSNYALLYSCISAPLIPINMENAWLMSRRPTLDGLTLNKLKSKLDVVGSNTLMLLVTEQSDCSQRDLI